MFFICFMLQPCFCVTSQTPTVGICQHRSRENEEKESRGGGYFHLLSGQRVRNVWFDQRSFNFLLYPLMIYPRSHLLPHSSSPLLSQTNVLHVDASTFGASFHLTFFFLCHLLSVRLLSRSSFTSTPLSEESLSASCIRSPTVQLALLLLSI